MNLRGVRAPGREALITHFHGFVKGSFELFFQENIDFPFEFSHLGGYLVYSAPRKWGARVVNKLSIDCCQVAGNRRNSLF